MKAIGIIPARMAATRYPGKPLALINGLPMIGHCYYRTCLALGRDQVYVATCDQEIADYILSIGGMVIMTSTSHSRASTRTAEALEKIEQVNGGFIDIVVMVQGDEPLIKPAAIADTLHYFNDPAVEIVNIMSKINNYETFIDRNNVKVVVNQNNDALYFSREPIPSPWRGWEDLPKNMQTGIIAFRRSALISFNSINETPLEIFESIDMNRVLESGGRIRMLQIEELTIGVDTPDELAEVEIYMQNDSTVLDYLN